MAKASLPRSVHVPRSTALSRSRSVSLPRYIEFSGNRPIGKLERLAYARHERDVKHGAKRGLVFDEAAADRAVRFFERYLKFGKGEWIGKPFTLEPWQRFVTRDIFGWKRADGRRRFKEAYIEVPRKNGKTEWAAGMALYLQLCDNEPGADVYCAATKRDQAAIVFQAAKRMIRQSAEIGALVKPMKSLIVRTETDSTVHLLSADHNSLDGLNVHGVIIDELHAHKSRELHDVLMSASGARRQPLAVKITTAGVGRQGICWENREYGEKILSRVFDSETETDSFFVFIAGADESDDWTSPETWRKANPNYGVSVSPEFLRDECAKAQRTPAYQNSFRRYYLNQWVEQANRWIDMGAWHECAGQVSLDLLRGKNCYVGIDLSHTLDLTALVALFPPQQGLDKWHVCGWAWVPADRIMERSRGDKVPYDEWARQGYIIPTQGNVVDYEAVSEKVEELCERFTIAEIAVDPNNATKFYTDLERAGHSNVVFVTQSYRGLSAATKEVERLVVSRGLVHDANPVLSWCMSNVCVRSKAIGGNMPSGDMMPDKQKSTERIDMVSALVTAMARAIANEAGKNIVSYQGLTVA